VDGRINKLRNVLFLNFFIDVQDGQGALWWVPNFRHLDYWQKYTVIQAIEHEIGSRGNFDRGRNDVFIIGPPERQSVNLSEFSRPNIDHYEVVLRA
jgi:hypothetical protein